MSAIFSEDRRYRYTLYREWPMLDGEERQGFDRQRAYVVFIGLNPSTADEVKDDPTIRRCRNFAKAWGYGQMFMLNLFAFRATKPAKMMLERDPVGPDNDNWLLIYAKTAGHVVAAWGRHGVHQGRDKKVLQLLRDRNVYQIGEADYPRHPLYLRGDLLPVAVKP